MSFTFQDKVDNTRYLLGTVSGDESSHGGDSEGSFKEPDMRRLVPRSTIAAALALISTLTLTQGVPARSLTDQVRELLRVRIEQAGVPPQITVGEDCIHASVMLPHFYEQRAYRPAWIGDRGPLPQAETLIRAIGEAGREGLRPNDYHLACVDAVLREVRENQRRKNPFNPRRLVDIDLILTDAFLLYGSHLLAGRINPETIDAEWHANRREKNLAEVLETALRANRIEESLENLLPSHSGYFTLRRALSSYRAEAGRGGWPRVSPGPVLRIGMCEERVAALRARLIASGDLRERSYPDEDLFDDALDEAVRAFQKRHGLEVDGVVGPATLAALNTPAEERVRQIELNLERWRWLPQNLGDRYILVNIAHFELDLIANGQPVMTMRVVVGKPYRRTPVFSDRVSYLVLSPYWHVPPSIALQDMLSLVRKDPEYLNRMNLKVFRGWGAETQEIDPESIDWTTVSAENFPYRLRQDPGPTNALGPVKFMFPNKFNVYLHGTPARELFLKAARGFSSGCIRLENPIELAEYLLRDDPKWTREVILATIDKGVEETVRLLNPIPVHLLYWTAWVDEGGSVHFWDDIYGRDELLDRAFREKPPSPW